MPVSYHWSLTTPGRRGKNGREQTQAKEIALHGDEVGRVWEI